MSSRGAASGPFMDVNIDPSLSDEPAHGPLQRHFITYDLSARSNPRRTPNVQNSNGRVNLSNQDLLKADQTVSDASDYGSARITGDDVASIFTNKRHSRLRNTEWITVKKCPREGQGECKRDLRSKSFGTRSAFSQHLLRFHPELDALGRKEEVARLLEAQETNRSRDSSVAPTQTPEVCYVCTKCEIPRTFTIKGNLRKHDTDFHDDRWLPLDTCTLHDEECCERVTPFEHRGDFTRHLEKQHRLNTNAQRAEVNKIYQARGVYDLNSTQSMSGSDDQDSDSTHSHVTPNNQEQFYNSFPHATYGYTGAEARAVSSGSHSAPRIDRSLVFEGQMWSNHVADGQLQTMDVDPYFGNAHQASVGHFLDSYDASHHLAAAPSMSSNATHSANVGLTSALDDLTFETTYDRKTEFQRAMLEIEFQQNKCPTERDIHHISSRVGLPVPVMKEWFNDRRSGNGEQVYPLLCPDCEIAVTLPFFEPSFYAQHRRDHHGEGR